VSRCRLSGILWALIAAGAAIAAEPPIKIDGLSVEGWKTADGPRTWIGAAVEEKIDGFVVFHQGFNLVDTQWLLLEGDGGKLDVFVFSYDTPANAFGLYTVMRRTIMQAGGAEAVGIADEAMFHPTGQLVAWAGRCCIIVTAAAPEPPEKPAFVAVAEKLAAQLEGTSERPELARALPTEGLDDSSIIYCHYRQALEQVFYAGEENVLRLGEDLTVPTQVEAVYAQYEIGNRPHKLVAIRYPEESEAGLAAVAFGDAQGASAKSDQTHGEWRDIEMRNGKHTLIYQSGKLLAFSPEAVSKEGAQRVIQSLVDALAPVPAPTMMQGG
jgi:hypothetical protein